MQRDQDSVEAEFARRLQTAMIAKGWKAHELAQHSREFCQTISRDQVVSYARGERLPGPEHLGAIAKALGLKPSDLISTSRGTKRKLQMQEVSSGKWWLHFEGEVSAEAAHEIQRLLAQDDNRKK